MHSPLPVTLAGHIVGGHVVLDDHSLALPDGAPVSVQVASVRQPESANGDGERATTTLRERLKNFLKHTIDDLPPDAAQNHDKYLRDYIRDSHQQ